MIRPESVQQGRGWRVEIDAADLYLNLGGILFDDLTDSQTVGDMTLTDVQSIYWTGMEFNSGGALIYRFGNGD